MSKELDYLDDILKNEPMTLNKRMIIEIIKEKIQRLESIDHANPSEALEWLNKFKGVEISSLPFKSEDGAVKEVDLNEVRFVGSQLNNEFRKFVYIIENALIKAQEQEKVFKIIKKKYVDIYLLKSINTLEEYNKNIGLRGIELTQEEFDLLKRWLENER